MHLFLQSLGMEWIEQAEEEVKFTNEKDRNDSVKKLEAKIAAVKNSIYR